MSEVKSSKKPEDNAFQQQRLKAWQPLLTPKWVIGTFLVVAILFIPIGAIILAASDSVVEYELRYDDKPTTTMLSFDITEDMDAPVYVYYKLTNYYQNHRRYVKSRNDAQLRGELTTDVNSLSSCDPLITQNDGTGDKVLYPCGLIANSVFYDTFNGTVTRAGLDKELTGNNWSKENIAWESDKDKFQPPADSVNMDDYSRIGTQGNVLKDVTDPDFMVWMRTAGLPTFKKLYRVITDYSLKKGDTLKIDIENIYPVADFKGQKWVVISTASWLGGKNSFLGWAYIIVGICCLVLALGFLIKHLVSPRDLGNMKYFNFPQLGAKN